MRRAVPAALLLLGLAACSSDPEKPADRPPPARKGGGGAILPHLRDLVTATYDARLAAAKEPRASDAASAERIERDARERLARVLEANGIDDARGADRERLLALALREVLASGRHALVFAPPDPSFSVVHLVEPRKPRAIEVFGERFAYELSLFDETAIPDFPTYRAARLAPPGAAPILRPAIALGHSVYVDVAAAERIGRESFFPRVDAYRALVARAADDAVFVEAARDAGRLLTLVKDVLRWRSLEGFWATVRPLPADERVRRFAEDYEAREEVRAAIEAYFLEKAGVAQDPTLTLEKLALVERRAMLAAIVHGEPLGEVATTVGLAARATGGGPVDPSSAAVLRAAAGVTAALVRELGRASFTTAGPSDANADARAFAALARATPDALRAAARAAYDRLPAMVSSAAPPR